MSYKIIRFYQNGKQQVLKTGLTLDQAQAHCNDPETSWKTCTKVEGKRRTKNEGPWFDGYREGA